MVRLNCLPHGWYSLVPAVLTTCGWIASLLEDGCDFSLVEGDFIASTVYDKLPFIQMGFNGYRIPLYHDETDTWVLSYDTECYQLPSEVVVDLPWKVSKFTSFLALVLGGGATFYLWMSTCYQFTKSSWRWAGYEVLLAVFFQALSFIWFQTDLCSSSSGLANCKLSRGAQGDILACVLWLAASVGIFFHYPEPINLLSPEEEQKRDGIMLENGGVEGPLKETIEDKTEDHSGSEDHSSSEDHSGSMELSETDKEDLKEVEIV